MPRIFRLSLAGEIMQHLALLARDLLVFHEPNLLSVLFFEDDRPPELGARLMDLMNVGPHH